MPDIDGMTILEDAAKRYPASKIIMITGFDEEGWRKRCFDLGAYEYITKPINLREILKKLEELYK